MQAPIARISNVLARYGVDPGRKPSWIEEVRAQHAARVSEEAAALRVRQLIR